MWLDIKIFVGSKVSSTNKWMKQNKFLELCTEEIQELTDNAIPVTTKKAIKFGMRILNGTYPLGFP